MFLVLLGSALPTANALLLCWFAHLWVALYTVMLFVYGNELLFVLQLTAPHLNFIILYQHCFMVSQPLLDTKLPRTATSRY